MYNKSAIPYWIDLHYFNHWVHHLHIWVPIYQLKFRLYVNVVLTWDGHLVNFTFSSHITGKSGEYAYNLIALLRYWVKSIKYVSSNTWHQCVGWQRPYMLPCVIGAHYLDLQLFYIKNSVWILSYLIKCIFNLLVVSCHLFCSWVDLYWFYIVKSLQHNWA